MSTIIVRDIRGYAASDYTIDVVTNHTLNIESEMVLPRWQTTSRPSRPETGMIGYNTQSGNFEVYDGTIWATSTPQTAITHVTNGLILYLDAGVSSSYSGSGTNWNDISGSGLVSSANLLNGVSFNPSPASLSFGGSTDRVTINNTIPSLSNFSIELFMRTSNLDGSQDIFFDQFSSLRFEINSNRYRIHLGSGGGWAFTDHVGNTTLVPNAWYQTVWTWNGSSSILYLNGNQDSIRTYGAASSGTGAINIGQHSPDTSYNWDGNIGIIKIYNRALSSSEVTQNFSAFRTRFGI